MESLSFSALIVGMLVSAVVCASLARSRGYSALLYGGLGVLLNVGAIPLTWLATTNTCPWNDGAHSRQLLAWSQHYHSLRQGLALAGVACLAGSLFFVFLLFVWVSPGVIATYEPVPRELLWPTRFVIGLATFASGPHFGSLLWGLNFSLPGLLYGLLVYGGYRVPLVGTIWRHTDQIWILLVNKNYRSLPPEVIRRLGNTQPVEVEDLVQEIQCERDRLSGVLWMAPLGLVPLLTFLAACYLYMVENFLPSCTLVGNIGG